MKKHYTPDEALSLTGEFIREQAIVLRENLRKGKKGIIESEYV